VGPCTAVSAEAVVTPLAVTTDCVYSNFYSARGRGAGVATSMSVCVFVGVFGDVAIR